MTAKEYLSPLLLTRNDDSHKGDYGHALLVCGCDAMPGAASLATGAALKSGCGLVTLHSSAYACQISAVSNPSAILSIDPSSCFSKDEFRLDRYSAVGIGPGLGKGGQTRTALASLLERMKEARIPAVLDADALNIIAEEKYMLDLLPAGSVMTPHDGELARLCAPWRNDEEKFFMAAQLADATGCIVVSKGWHTKVFVPGGQEPHINPTGNPGMAKGGSGDVLTGLLTGLVARGYPSETAALAAVWIHGFAGDCCTEEFGPEAYNSRDLIDNLYKGFKELYK